MKKLLLFILLSGTAVFAQIQITSADVANILAPGKAWVETANDTPNVSMNVGSASGTSQAWIVPNITWKDTITAVNITPSSSPYSSDFPGATHCQYFSGIVEGIPAMAYDYYLLNNSALFSLGTAAHVKFLSIDTILVLKDTVMQFSLPVTYGTSKQISSDTIDFFGSTFITTVTQSVDAFGNISMPFGTFPALRITENTIDKTYQNGNLVAQTSSPSFTWVTTAGIFQADIDTASGASGTVTLTSASLVQFTNAPLAVNDQGISAPSAFMLYQNYPNPFNPSTKIRYTIPASIAGGSNNLVTLKIYDMLGNEIATLVNGEKPAGTYEVEFSAKSRNGADLPSGVYFYRLTAGSFVQTQKMILLK
jgi:FlgD Ig-like domain